MKKQDREKGPSAGLPRRAAMPDIFGGAEKKTRPASVTIKNKSPQEVYAFVRDFSHLPLFMKHLSRVERISPTAFRWVVIAPAGAETSWDTEIIADQEGELIAWKNSPGSAFEQSGAITFEPAEGREGTVVGLKLAYNRPLGRIAGVTEKLVGMAGKFEEGGDPDTEAAINVRRLKSLLETGEVPTVDGQPTGKEGEQDESTMLAG